MRVAFSLIGVHILAAANSINRGSLMAKRNSVLYQPEAKLSSKLAMDSNGLYSTISTLHESNEYFVLSTTTSMRTSFGTVEIVLIYVSVGKHNKVGTLRKRNLLKRKLLNNASVFWSLCRSCVRNQTGPGLLFKFLSVVRIICQPIAYSWSLAATRFVTCYIDLTFPLFDLIFQVVSFLTASIWSKNNNLIFHQRNNQNQTESCSDHILPHNA